MYYCFCLLSNHFSTSKPKILLIILYFISHIQIICIKVIFTFIFLIGNKDDLSMRQSFMLKNIQYLKSNINFDLFEFSLI